MSTLAFVLASNLGTDFDLGGAVPNKLNIVRQLDSYRYIKAINANSTTSGGGGFDAALEYLLANNTPGSNAVQAAGAVFAPAGGDFEALVLKPWLMASPSASPPGLGLSASAASSLVATLRSSALTSGF